ncbi:MAG: two-component regulator propeller domain-containing protein [Paludibacter sp.]|nr:two-component regulator propeller domain-containing protein [Paludibacter sp.]
MLHLKKILVFCYFSIICTLTCSSALSFFFDYYTVQDGLSNSSVKAIFQDKDGYIWFGTKDGLNRFDGNEFKIFRSDINKTNTIVNNDVTCIVGDKHGNLWIGTFNGISLLDRSTEKFLDFAKKNAKVNLPEGVVTDIYIDDLERVWVSTKKGLYLINTSTYEVTVLLKGVNVNCMNVCGRGFLLAEVIERGLALIDVQSLKIEYVCDNAKGRPIINEIFRDSQGQVWLGSITNSLFLYAEKQHKLVPVPLNTPEGMSFKNEQIHCIREFNDTTLVFGTNTGLFLLNPKTRKCTVRVNNTPAIGSINHDRIMSLCKDSQGGLWVGTFAHGINYYNPYRNQFKFYDLKIDNNEPIGIAGNIVECNGTLWVGHEKGVSSLSLKTGQMHYYDIQSMGPNAGRSKDSKFIFKENNETLWIYLLNNGLYTFDVKKKKLFNRISIAPSAQVRSIAQDGKGRFWIAEEELSIYDPKSRTINANLITNIDSKTKFTLAQCILVDDRKNIWVGTRTDGVILYSYEIKGGKENLMARNRISGLSSANISVLFEDRSHRLWIGTYGAGIYCYIIEKDSVIVYDDKNGLQHNLICGIQEDEATGDIWVSTLTGVSKIVHGNSAITNYTFRTGFPLREISQNSFIKASDGNFYIGGSNGVASFRPSDFLPNPYKPHVKINSLKSLAGAGDNKSVNYTTPTSLENIVLDYSQSSFVISFTALNFLFPKENRYAYKLEGIDNEWINSGNRHEATYTNLLEGEYLFCVKASNNDGVWNDDFTTLKIKVLPPFWRTWWAKCFYLIIALILLYIIIQYLISKKTYEYKLQIKQIEKQNIEENHQMRLRLFTNFSHELRTPLTLIIGPLSDMLKDSAIPEKLKYSLRMMDKNANRLLLLVNQLMDFRKLESNAMKLHVRNVDLLSFINELLATFQALADKKQIQLKCLYEYEGNNIWFDTILIEKVIFNLLSNAFKNSNSGDSIIVQVSEEKENLLISVKDTGLGIASEDIKQIFDPFFQVSQGDVAGMFGSGIGLNLSKSIVELHSGVIWAESKPGEGAIFNVQLPLGSAHFMPTDFVTEEVDNRLNQSTEKHSLLELNEGSSEMIKESDGLKKVILVIEDDPDVLNYIKHQLVIIYEVLEAENGADGFMIAADVMPDLIISDVMMPIMNGIELCNKLKSDMRTAHIPIILLTARTMTEQVQEGYEYGADDYMLKPFDSALLKTRVKNLILGREKLRKLFKMNIALPDVDVLKSSSDEKFLRKVFDFIEKNIDNSELCIEDFSDEIGMSRVQLYRKLKALTDTTPSKLILQVRMKVAVKFLQSKEYPINEIAYKVGFSDPAYFSKCFKAIYHTTPKAYSLKYISPVEGEDE